ncbi:MAG TPA: POTRA domain-containing protein, partial [Allosphingosinicella sp.]
MLKRSLIAVALLTPVQGIEAQQRPDAGQQIRQIPPPPIRQNPAPDLELGRSAAAPEAAAGGARVRVNALKVSGQTLFSEAELIAATDFQPGTDVTLAELRALAAQISEHYNSRGYFLAHAYLPAQDVQDGTVAVQVIEGKYGSVALRNESGLSSKVANGVLKGLDGGDTVATAGVERRLLLLSDIPGINVRSVLAPGALVGTSDLLVHLTPGRRLTGSMEADNGGNRYTGAYRLGGSAYFNNLTGMGDVASLRLLASKGGLLYGRASYQAQLGNATLGAAFAHVDYQLGREFESLDARGTADIFSVFGAYPLVRSRDTNLYALGSLDAKLLEDKLGLTDSQTNRSTRSGTIGFRGDHHDSLGGGGWNVFSVGATAGSLDIKTPALRADDAATAGRQGGFGKMQFSVARLQSVTGPLSLYLGVRGQLAANNLDSSEQMALGGPYGVRAYPEGESYGDEGYLATAEARLLLPDFTGSLPGRVQLIGFLDTGAVTFNK